MSTEQSESAPSAVTETKAAPSAVTAPQVETKAAPAGDTTRKATTPAATTQHVKNPKHVAAGKMVAERSRLAREEQKKAAEAYYAEKQAEAARVAPDTKEKSPNSGGLSANQWIAIGGVGVFLLGIYYKREELMAMAKPVFDKFKTPKPAPEPASVEPKPALDTRPRGLKNDLNVCA